MELVQYAVKSDTRLREAGQLMGERASDFLVVTEPKDDRRLVWLVTPRSIDRALESEIARRRGYADVPTGG